MSPDADLAALYTRGLRDIAARVRVDKRLVPADVSVTRTSRACGSSVTLDICRDGSTITTLGWRTRACTLGMAATALVVAHVPGRTFEELAEVAVLLRRLLAGEDVLFPAPWHDLAMFATAQDLPARHGSIMLPFDALAEAA